MTARKMIQKAYDIGLIVLTQVEKGQWCWVFNWQEVSNLSKPELIELFASLAVFMSEKDQLIALSLLRHDTPDGFAIPLEEEALEEE